MNPNPPIYDGKRQNRTRSLSEFRRKMEPDIREILLCHGQHIAGIGQIDVAPFFVERHILGFTFLEIL